MSRLYRVLVPGLGELLKSADSIAEARAWVRKGFSESGITVQPYVAPRGLCQCCASRPCVKARRVGGAR